jgi:hypothetical protein
VDLDTLSRQVQVGFQSLHIELAEVKRTAELARDQAVQTNGRVTMLEQWRSYMDGVKAGAGGLWQYAIAAAGFALVIVNLYVALTQ